MGTSSSRSIGSSSKGKNSSEVLDPEQLKLLAPTDAFGEDNDENYECCICFVNYLAINHTSCCNERICTNCYLLISSNNQANRGKVVLMTKSMNCPFCGKKSFSVVYRPLRNDDPSNSETRQSHEVTIENTAVDKSSKKKLSNKTTINIPMSTIADRKQIENDIKSQHYLFKTNLPLCTNFTQLSNENNFMRRSQYRNDSSNNDSSTVDVDNNSNCSIFAGSLKNLLNNTNYSDFDKIDELILEETMKMSLTDVSVESVINNRNNFNDNVLFPPVPPSGFEESNNLPNSSSHDISEMREMLASLTATGNLSEDEELALIIQLSQNVK